MTRHITLAVGLAMLACACRSEQPAAPSASTTETPPPAPPPPSAQTTTASATNAPSAAAPTGAALRWTFDADKPDAPPAGFSFGRTGNGKMGSWVVKAEADAPSKPNVLAQVDTDGTDYRFPIAVANEPTLRDLGLSVRCKPVSGSVDQACGLVFRYRDEKNYYVTRANALENNVRLYSVKDGNRRQFESWSGPVTSKTWHELRVDARGDHFEVYWDGKKVIDGHDETFPDAGKVGVWTKADSVTYFDDLAATPL